MVNFQRMAKAEIVTAGHTTLDTGAPRRSDLTAGLLTFLSSLLPDRRFFQTPHIANALRTTILAGGTFRGTGVGLSLCGISQDMKLHFEGNPSGSAFAETGNNGKQQDAHRRIASGRNPGSGRSRKPYRGI
jgi:hypothetical protein